MFTIEIFCWSLCCDPRSDMSWPIAIIHIIMDITTQTHSCWPQPDNFSSSWPAVLQWSIVDLWHTLRSSQPWLIITELCQVCHWSQLSLVTHSTIIVSSHQSRDHSGDLLVSHLSSQKLSSWARKWNSEDSISGGEEPAFFIRWHQQSTSSSWSSDVSSWCFC